MLSGSLKIETQLPGLAKTPKIAREASGGVPPVSTQLAAALVGALTTRTSDTAGTLTMGAGHGIVDGDILAIFSDTSCSYLAVVGLVAGASVPFTAAAGDVLPADESAVTVQVMEPHDVDFDGDKLEMFLATFSARGVAVYEDAANDVIFAPEILAGEAVLYATGLGLTNPLAGDAIDQVWIANADSAQVNDFNMGGLLNTDT